MTQAREDQLHLTDVGNGQRFARQHGPDVRFCWRFGSWFVWDGRRSQRDDGDQGMAKAKETALSIYTEAATEQDPDRRKALATWAKGSEGEPRLQAMLSLAQSEPGLPVTPEQLDADPWLLNVENGTLELRTGKLRKHRREDLITKLVPVAYDPVAPCPRWEGFLAQIFDGNKQVIEFVQKAIGYALTGDTREQVLFILWGTGSNGKTTLLTTIYELLAEYALATTLALILPAAPRQGAARPCCPGREERSFQLRAFAKAPRATAP